MTDEKPPETVSDYARKKLLAALRVKPRDLLRKELRVIQGGKKEPKSKR